MPTTIRRVSATLAVALLLTLGACDPRSDPITPRGAGFQQTTDGELEIWFGTPCRDVVEVELEFVMDQDDQDPLRQKLSHAFGAVDDDGDTADVAIDFTGAATAVQSAFGRLDTGGRLVLAGSVTPSPPISVDPERVVRQWLTITGIHNYEPRHLAQAVAFLDATREKYPWAELVDTPVPLADLTRVLAPTPPGILRSSVSPHTRS